MRIDPHDGAIYLPHSKQAIQRGMSAETLFKTGVLSGTYHLRQQEYVQVTIGEHTASLDLFFVDGIFTSASIFLTGSLPLDYETMRTAHEQAIRDLGLTQPPYSWGSCTIEMQPQSGEMWLAIKYF